MQQYDMGYGDCGRYKSRGSRTIGNYEETEAHESTELDDDPDNPVMVRV